LVLVTDAGSRSLGIVGTAPRIFTVWEDCATGEPLQLAVCPVNTNLVEQPASSVTLSVTVYVPGLA
jgi:hypothetical protein